MVIPTLSSVSLQDIEYKIHSQNGEDGILNYLISCLPIKTKTFVEIGCGTGNECNTTYLVKQGWSGTVFDQKPARIDQYQRSDLKADSYCLKITPDNIDQAIEKMILTPDVFSLDIDSYDYWVMKALMEKGFSPAICVLEYNKDRDNSLEYPPPKNRDKRKDWGCGLQLWKELLQEYTFVTVDSTQINAFFIRGTPPELINRVRWLDDHGSHSVYR